jgi:hypothetical protein
MRAVLRILAGAIEVKSGKFYVQSNSIGAECWGGTMCCATKPADKSTAKPFFIYDRDRPRGTLDQVRQQASRQRPYAVYAQVKQLQAKGGAIIQIARELHISR